MGLDWNPTPRAKPGSEAKFERLMGIDLDEIDDVDREATIARIHAISETPFETIGAPRVGYDPRADSGWLSAYVRRARSMSSTMSGRRCTAITCST
jgi:hypothetical protein